MSKPLSPWSSFHSTVAIAARGPGTPVRQQEIEREESTRSSALEEFNGCLTDVDLLLEYKLLCLNCPSGVYVLPSSKSLYEWHGILFVHSGPYREGIFRFTIYIPDGFPRVRPMLRFHSKVYHPYIHMHNGVLNMSRVFPNWDPAKHQLWHVVQYTKQCFYSQDSWQDCEQSSFTAQAQQCVRDSLRTLFDPQEDSVENSGNLIHFHEVDEKLYSQAKKTLLAGELPKAPITSPSQNILSNVTEQFKQLWEKVIPR